MPDVHQILIFQTAYLGDVVLSTPLIAATRKRFPQAAIDVVVQPAWAPIVNHHPDIRHVIAFDKRGAVKGPGGTWRFAALLRGKRYDLVFCPHPSFRSALILRLAQIPARVGFHDSSGSFFFTRKVRRDKDLHEVHRVLSLIEAFGPLDGEFLPKVHLPQDLDADRLCKKLGIRAGNLAGLHPGSVWATKRWPEESFTALAQNLGRKFDQVLVFGGPGETDLSARIAENAGENVYDLGGKLNLEELGAVLSRLSCFVTNDSGPMHMAAAFNAPVVAIFGSTVPKFGYTPFNTKSRIVEVDFDCRPCGPHGFDACPQKHFRCMKDITVDMALAACDDIA